MGNSLGQLLIAPLLLAWLTPTRNHTPPLRWFEFVAFGVIMVVIPLLAKSEVRANALLFLAFSYTLLTWMGQRCGIRVVTVANLVFTGLVVWVGMSGSGFMSYLPEAERFFHISFFIAIGVLFSMLLSTTLEERRALIHQLTELAIKDDLTQLSNRRHFQERAQDTLIQAQRHGAPTCLAILDLDHFKRINDTHGHAFGDEVLKMFARCSSSTLRPGDVLGRIGGEEFALLLPRTNLAAARQAVQRLLDQIARQVMVAPDGTSVRVTASAGLIEADAGASLSALYYQADQALYEAKNAGRNRIWTLEGCGCFS